MASGAHKYPELVQQGLGHLWVGPGFNDFAPQLIAGAVKFLKKRELPCERGDAINAIRNKVRGHDWGYLEQRFEEGAPKADGAVGEGASAPPPRPMPQAEPWKPIWEIADE
jgi:hypothetical protein